MTKDQHIARHKRLHKMLDELAADFMAKTGRLPSQSTVMDLMTWSYEQTINPAEEDAPIKVCWAV